MARIGARKENGKLYFDFNYQGVRCREQTRLDDTAENRRNMKKVLKKIEAEITLGTFEYARFFPSSPQAGKFKKMADQVAIEEVTATQDNMPLYEKFSREWFDENVIRWKRSYKEMIDITLTNYLIPTFGEQKVCDITKGDILKFRSTLAKVPNGTKEGLSPDRINHIMTPLRMILDDAADRFDFTTPYRGIKPLRVEKTQVDPFSLDEVNLFLANVRADFRNYYTVRFLTGLRTAEIDGLKWQYVDFDRRIIHVRETLVKSHEETTKNEYSERDIEMSPPVYDALMRQQAITAKKGDFVFISSRGTPLQYSNVSNRIWFPTLKALGLRRRRPYQTRHTTATLWLASGENPEWIARQMGHSNTRMLFTTYSRFVPNLTRTDGSAFERLLAAKLPLAEKE